MQQRPRQHDDQVASGHVRAPVLFGGAVRGRRTHMWRGLAIAILSGMVVAGCAGLKDWMDRNAVSVEGAKVKKRVFSF